MQLLEPWMLTKQVSFGASSGAKSKNSAAERGNRYHQKVYKLLKLNIKNNRAWERWELLVEPWFRNKVKRTLRSPDSVLLDREAGLALVVEVKLNWQSGRDDKLINEYLPIVANALGVKTKPVLVTQCLRNCPTQPLIGLQNIFRALEWRPGQPTPVALVP